MPVAARTRDEGAGACGGTGSRAAIRPTGREEAGAGASGLPHGADRAHGPSDGFGASLAGASTFDGLAGASAASWASDGQQHAAPLHRSAHAQWWPDLPCTEAPAGADQASAATRAAAARRRRARVAAARGVARGLKVRGTWLGSIGIRRPVCQVDGARRGFRPPASRRRPCWWGARPPSRAGAGFRAGLG